MSRIIVLIVFSVIALYAECNLKDDNVTEFNQTQACIKMFQEEGTKYKTDIKADRKLLIKLRTDIRSSKRQSETLKDKLADRNDTNTTQLQDIKQLYLDFATMENNLTDMLSLGETPELFDINLILGVQLQPTYDDNGSTKGFTHSTLYAKINIDARFGTKNTLSTAGWLGPCSAGIDLEYLGTPIDTNSTDNVNITNKPKSFNDVTNTFQATIYGSFDLYHLGNGSDIGLITQIGGLSRDEKDVKENNTLNHFVSGGLEYVYSDLITKTYLPKDSYLYNKKYPKAKFQLLYRYYNAHGKNKKFRAGISDFEYKYDSFLFGFNGTFGTKTNDTMYLKFGFVKSADDFLEFFIKP